MKTETAMFVAHDRYGWGWGVRGPAGTPAVSPTCTYAAAEHYAEKRNDGATHEDAYRSMIAG
jgi:hypothetical protein